MSVILATYNRAHYLPEALDSILNQTNPPEEIIVVDDGSTDNTTEVVERYASRIRYFKTGNHGKAAALNFAIPLTQASHIWIFDDDDVALQDALQSHVDFLGAHPEVDFSYSTNYRYSGSGDIWQRDEWIPKTVPDWPSDIFLTCIMQGIHTLLQGMLIPKHCLLEVGLFDTTLLRVQDTDILIKLAHRFRARNIQKPTFVLRDHAGARGPGTQGHTAVQRAAIQVQYQQRIFRKLRQGYPLSSYLPHEPGTPTPVLNEAERGQALIQRSCVMLRQGLTDEALEDLANGLNHLKQTSSSVHWIGPILSKAIDVDPRRFPQPFHLILGLSKILKTTGAGILALPIARGTYWSFKRSMRQHLWLEAVVSAGMLSLTVLCNPRVVLTLSRRHPSSGTGRF